MGMDVVACDDEGRRAFGWSQIFHKYCCPAWTDSDDCKSSVCVFLKLRGPEAPVPFALVSPRGSRSCIVCLVKIEC